MKHLKKALITGICGQDGAYLAQSLLNEGYKVIGLTRRSSLDHMGRLRVLNLDTKIDIRSIDMTEQYAIFELIQLESFDEIYNLAAQSFVGASWDTPIATTMTNSLGPLYILEAIKRFSPHTKLYQASSSEMFGLTQEPIQDEDTKLYPRSPYGVSKVFAHQMLINYRESFKIHACSGILFNHESPLRGLEFVTKKITRTLAKIKLGADEILNLGNIDVKRDWGYAPEYVEGMKLMLRYNIPDDYVLATGKTTSVREFVNFASQSLNLELEWDGIGLDEVARDKVSGKTIVQINEYLYRPAEVDLLMGSSQKANANLGWMAKTGVDELAEIMVKYDFDELK